MLTMKAANYIQGANKAICWRRLRPIAAVRPQSQPQLNYTDAFLKIDGGCTPKRVFVSWHCARCKRLAGGCPKPAAPLAC
jgi:hypothetical protein